MKVGLLDYDPSNHFDDNVLLMIFKDMFSESDDSIVLLLFCISLKGYDTCLDLGAKKWVPVREKERLEAPWCHFLDGAA